MKKKRDKILVWLVGLLGVVTAARGDVIVFEGNMTLAATSHLDIAISGPTVEGGYNRLEVMGDLTLGGVLNVSLAGYSPVEGDVFDILDFDVERLSGEFQEVNLPVLTGDLLWDISELYVSGELSVYVPCMNPGDITGDCFVQLEDLAAMAAAWQTVAGGVGWDERCDIYMPADGVVDMDDLAQLAWWWLE